MSGVSLQVVLSLVSRSEKGKLPLERKMRPAVGPAMRDCGMRQLLVMSPRAFLGYEFSPAVAGAALPPLSPHNKEKVQGYTGRKDSHNMAEKKFQSQQYRQAAASIYIFIFTIKY